MISQHLSSDDIARFVNGDHDDLDLESLRAHIRDCASCAAALGREAVLDEELRAIEPELRPISLATTGVTRVPPPVVHASPSLLSRASLPRVNSISERRGRPLAYVRERSRVSIRSAANPGR